MNEKNRFENAKLEIEKGDAALEEARILFENKKYDGAVSRAYYAAFHYACAALLSKGIESRSHQGMQRLFHLHFIRTNVFDAKAGLILSHAQKAREEADYYPEVSFTHEVASEQFKEVKSLWIRFDRTSVDVVCFSSIIGLPDKNPPADSFFSFFIWLDFLQR